MKTIILILLFELITQESFAKGILQRKTNSSGDNQLTFNSKFGYQIQYPACLEISPIDVAYEADADPTTVDIHIGPGHKSKCNLGQKEIGLGIKRLETKKPDITSDQWIDQTEKAAIKSKAMGGENYILLKRKPLPNLIYFKASEWRKQYIRMSFYGLCGNQLFLLSFDRDIKDLEDTVISDLKSGKLNIPRVEKEIIESFKCTKAK